MWHMADTPFLSLMCLYFSAIYSNTNPLNTLKNVINRGVLCFEGNLHQN